jgi:hypothetical protein
MAEACLTIGKIISRRDQHNCHVNTQYCGGFDKAENY